MLSESSTRLDAWIEAQGFKGWDPYDALNSPLLKRLTFRNRRLGQLWVQLLKHSPVNLRPLLGVAQDYNPKSMGLFLESYCRKYLFTREPIHLEHVRFFADWLRANTSPGYSGACWGYNFDWPNRGFFAPAGTPTIVNTAFIGLAFLDCIRLSQLQLPISNLQSPLSVARSACDFVLHDLNRIHPTSDELCFSYTPQDRRCVHNANLLGAWLLAETYARTCEPPLAEHALAACRFTVRRQRPNGSWPYGEQANEAWVDNFHTGFVLVALHRIGRSLATDEFESSVARGYAYWKAHFFRPDGAPKYYPHRTYPIDAHSVAQAILTFLHFAESDPEARPQATRIARWALTHMQDPAGFFHYQIWPTHRIRIPYMRWAQAWMQRALVQLMSA